MLSTNYCHNTISCISNLIINYNIIIFKRKLKFTICLINSFLNNLFRLCSTSF